MDENDPVEAFSEEECWDFLRKHEFGRLAYHLVDEVHIVPINYAEDQGALLFRTAEGSKLLGIVMNNDVAFEVDQIDDDAASSVVLRGTARQLPENELHRIENLPLRPWVPTLKYDVVEITVKEISGRKFFLSRPWTHMVNH